MKSVETAMNSLKLVGYGTLFVTLLLGCGGGDSDEDKHFKEMISQAKRLADLLEGVTDAESAKKAEPEVDKLEHRLSELGKATRSWPEEKREAMRLKYEKDLNAVKDRIADARANYRRYRPLSLGK
jgi:hypothetical protein